jgi:plastocyanin
MRGIPVFWKSVDKGHNVEFIKDGVPEGVEKFKSKLSQDTKYTFTIQVFTLTGAHLIKVWA